LIAPLLSSNGWGQRIQGRDDHTRRWREIEWAMASIGAGALGLVVFLALCLVAGVDRTPTVPGGAASAPRTAANQRPGPELAPVRGQGEHALEATVVDGAGVPVARAWVMAELELGAEPGPEPHPVVVGETGADGAVRLEGLEPGRHRLRVEGERLVAAEVRLVEVPGAAIRILVAREASVTGRVLGLDGKPVARALVRLLSPGNPPLEVRSGRDGGFGWRDLAAGRYRISAHAESRASATVPLDRLDPSRAEPVTLILVPATRMRGRVVDLGTGRGVMADITISPADPDEPPRIARSDGDGRFDVEGLPFGSYSAGAVAPGYLTGELVRFEASSEIRPILPLRRGAIVTGRVVDPAGAPIAGATVLARGEGEEGVKLEVGEASRSTGGQGALGWQRGGGAGGGAPRHRAPLPSAPRARRPARPAAVSAAARDRSGQGGDADRRGWHAGAALAGGAGAGAARHHRSGRPLSPDRGRAGPLPGFRRPPGSRGR
jgi:hypothetical protein